MKICIIGNSHIAAIKQGWMQVESDFPDFQVTFFGARGRKMSGLRVRGDRLVPANAALAAQMSFVSGGIGEIVPKDYDVILLSGLGLFVPRLPAGSSAALRRQASVEYVENSVIPGIIAKLRLVTDETIWVSPSPLVASIDDLGTSAMVPYATLLESLRGALNDEKCVMLGQPPDSIAHDLTTLSMFREGSMRLTTPNTPASKEMHRDLELKHMNGAFGALWLTRNLPRFAESQKAA